MPTVPWFDAQRLLTLVNIFREQQGLATLALDPKLCEVAQELSNHQARINKMTHSGPTGLSVGKRLTSWGYRWQAVGENVGYGHSSLEQAMGQWINSPPHRKNLLGPNFTKFGAAAAVSKSGLVYLTQEFAKPLSQNSATSALIDAASLSLERMLQLVNEYRLANNVSPLILDQKLIATAQKLATFMANKGKLIWQGPNGESQADRAAQEEFNYSILGQNIAVGFKNESEAAEVWMKNSASAKPLMDPRVTRLGVAFALGLDGKAYWVQDFGRLQNEEEPVVMVVKPNAGKTTLPKFTSPTRPSPMQALEAEKRICLPNTSNQVHRPAPIMDRIVSSPPSPPASPVAKKGELVIPKRKAQSSLVDISSSMVDANEPVVPSPQKAPLKKMKTFSLLQRFLGVKR